MRSATRLEFLISSAFQRMRAEAIGEIWILKEKSRFRKDEREKTRNSDGNLPEDYCRKLFKTGIE